MWSPLSSSSIIVIPSDAFFWFGVEDFGERHAKSLERHGRQKRGATYQYLNTHRVITVITRMVITMIPRMLMNKSRATTTWFWRRVSPTRTSMATATLTSSISSLRWTALPSHQLDGRKKCKTSHHQLSDETVWFLWTMKMFLLQPFNGFWFVWFWNIFSRSTDTTTGCQGTTSWYISPYHKYCCNMMRTTSTSTSTSTTSMQRNQR